MKSKIALLLVGTLLILSVGDALFAPETALGDAVVVSATVGSNISISTDGSPTSFSTITTGAVSTSTPNTTSTLTCNSGIGCQMTVYDNGYSGNPGLASSTTGYLIWSPGDTASTSATATLAAGTFEGFGIQAATTSAGSPATTMTLNRRYTDSGELVIGGIPCGSTNAVQVASSTFAVSAKTIVVTHKASISGLTEQGAYTDTLTYSYASN